MDKMQSLMCALQLNFSNIDLLKQALTHRSFLNENPKVKTGHNERLEFLGDAVLEIVVTEHLFHAFPDHAEGDLTNWRSSLVNSKMLALVADEINLSDSMFLSRGESKERNVRSRQYIMANAVEALIGAIYLDIGMDAAKKFIERYIMDKFDEIMSNESYIDSKSKFQEKAQEYCGVTPHYKVLSESGPDHAKVFEIGLYVGDDLIASASGESKQEAQMEAARIGLELKEW